LLVGICSPENLGASNTETAYRHLRLPFLILPVYGSMRALDRDLLKTAANLGASPTRAFWLVFLPLTLPGLLAGAPHRLHS